MICWARPRKLLALFSRDWILTLSPNSCASTCTHNKSCQFQVRLPLTSDSWTEKQSLYKQQLDRKTVTVQIMLAQQNNIDIVPQLKSWTERQLLYNQKLDRETVTVQSKAGQRDSYCTSDSWTVTVSLSTVTCTVTVLLSTCCLYSNCPSVHLSLYK